MNKWILFSGAIILITVGQLLNLGEYFVGGFILAVMGVSLLPLKKWFID